jgi:hypothetical protein
VETSGSSGVIWSGFIHQEIQELVVKWFIRSKWIKWCWYIRKFRNTGVSGSSGSSGAKWIKWCWYIRVPGNTGVSGPSGSSGANGLNGLGSGNKKGS